MKLYNKLILERNFPFSACRRRWKQIVEEYIRSPHAESMRKRNW